MQAQRNQIENSQELPVDAMYNQAITDFLQTHKDLSKLPADPSEPALGNAQNMLRDMGVDVDSDYSMFVMGAVGQIGTDFALSAMGIETGTTTAMGLDIASGVLMGLHEESGKNTPTANNSNTKTKQTGLNKKTTSSVFRMSAFARNKEMREAMKYAARPAPKAAKKGPALRHIADKRKKLKANLAIQMENIKELQAFKSCGVQYARRVSVPNGLTGEMETYLVAAQERPNMALKSTQAAKQRASIDLSAMPRPSVPRLCA